MNKWGTSRSPSPPTLPSLTVTLKECPGPSQVVVTLGEKVVQDVETETE